MDPLPAKLRRRRARSRADLVRAIEAFIPVEKTLPITDGRLRRAYRAVLVEGFMTLQSVLGWGECVLEVGAPDPPPRQGGRIVGSSLGSSDARHASVVEPAGGAMYTARAQGAPPSYPLAREFASCVASSMRAALETSRVIHDARHGAIDEGYELLAAGVGQTILTSFLRALIEDRPSPLATFMLGHRPFTASFLASSSVLDWARSLAATTYEGAPIRTGLVIEAQAGGLKHVTGMSVVPFQKAVPFVELGGQELVLADGERTFLAVRPDLRVIGVARLDAGLEAHAALPAPESLVLPLSAVWIHASRPEMVRLFASTRTTTFQFAHVKRGVFQLYNRDVAEKPLTRVLAAVVNDGQVGLVPGLARQLLRRAEGGHGAGVVLGAPTLPGGRRPKEPVTISDDGPWLPFLEPDGAVVIDRAMRLVGYRVNLQQPKKKLLPHRGTRHNALARASLNQKRVAVAVSDDGSLMAFRNGKAVLVIP